MASQAWLESSLQRSASLGLEVLERASRRSVDWTRTGASQSPATTYEDTQIPVKVPRTHTEADDIFATIAEFMVQTTHQCKRFYQSGCCPEPTDTERNHVSRFHSRPAVGMTTPAHSARQHGRVSAAAAGEDFVIEVSPGTYAITASMPELEQQTQLVSVKAGESINLTFNL
ncbi:A-kinase-interacting protein 1 isoform X1 [Etheostoma spectabile]|uniref:A-kinase-interacting protein 1 isoform X1 n=1 Tax=Etheostoma spectabile TaxID=54343 RepID=UPI0013AFB741|nr:A-kinase-interacting protein 1 isoform X1 [Etheostoma spectabile]XP_032378594.1 A-kinase-interacting protein 1 isoform X1 [Etheostoma spectabile]